MAQQIYHHDYGLPEPLIVTLSREEGREKGREADIMGELLLCKSHDALIPEFAIFTEVIRIQ